MLYILSKLIYVIAMPITWILIFTAIGFFYKKGNVKRNSKFIAFGLLLLFTNPWIANMAFEKYEYPLSNLNNVEKSELGILLTGCTMRVEHKDKRTFFNKGADRVVHTFYLYNRGIINKILITGGSGAITHNEEQREANKLKLVLLEMGVRQEDIITETNARNTHENAVFSQVIIKEKFPDCKPILITSAFHLRRSIACFKKVGVEVTPFSVDIYTKRTKTEITDFIPKESALALWGKLIHECLGLMTYKVLGWA